MNGPDFVGPEAQTERQQPGTTNPFARSMKEYNTRPTPLSQRMPHTSIYSPSTYRKLEMYFADNESV